MRGGIRRGSWALAVALGALIACALSATVAMAAPGDVYTVDRGAQTVWKLGPAGGEAAALSADPDFGSPYGMTLGPDGFLYVADESGFVFKVNRATGDTSHVLDFGSTNPIDVAFDARGRLFMVDYQGNEIHLVNRTASTSSVFFDGPGANGFNSLAIQRNGAMFIGDESAGSVYRLRGGTLTTIVDAGDDPDFGSPDGIMLSPDERFLYIGSYDVPRFFRYDLRTRDLQQFEIGLEPYSLALLPSNRLIFSDASGPFGSGDLDTVSRLGGATALFSSDPDLNNPRDVVVEPRRCGGRFPTIVGTNAKEVITGSRFADVISTLGGKDIVNGLQGKDIICLGGGKDRGFGGGGKDRILGEAGADLTNGGKGNDVCRGGAGRDTARSC